jgi:hypothetical protein
VNGTKPAGGNVTVVNVPVNQPAPKSLKIY